MRVIVCENCNGTGAEVCGYCAGSGDVGSEVCPVCDGDKKETCSSCWGSGDLELPQDYSDDNQHRSWREEEWS